MTTGSRTLKDAINEAYRDWVAERRDDQLHLRHRGRPAPVPGHGARLPEGHRRGGARAAARGGRPASRRRPRLRRRRIERDRHVRRVPRRRGRAALRRGGRRRRRRHPDATRHPSNADAPACCTARRPTSCRTRTARRSSRTRSRRAWTTRASAPSTRGSRRSVARSTSPRPTTRRCRRCGCSSATEGIIPAIESAHALAGALRMGSELGPDAMIAICLSGRGDKDMDTAARYFELYDAERRPPSSPTRRSRAPRPLPARGSSCDLARRRRRSRARTQRAAARSSATCRSVSPTCRPASRPPSRWPRAAPTSSSSARPTPTR